MISIRIRRQLAGFALDVDFAAATRGIVALYGRSGSGKTSIVRAIAGALRPDSGRISIDGRLFFDSAHRIDLPIHERRVGYVFQDSRLFPHLSVRGNLLYGFHRVRGERPLTPDAVIGLLGIAPLLERRIHDLSGGERQRVAIGRALLAQPSLLLMDEPLSSLDPARKAELLPYIEGLRDELGLPILYISHVFDEILRLADHLVVLDAGKVVRAGALMDVASDPSLFPHFGRFDAGAIIDATLEGHEAEAGLSVLAFAGGLLRVPRVDFAAGTAVRVRIRARDVAIALSQLSDVSITNQVPGRVLRIVDQDGPYAEVLIDAGGAQLRALLTRQSVQRLGLRAGLPVWALVKAVAFEGRSLGLRRLPRRPSGTSG